MEPPPPIPYSLVMLNTGCLEGGDQLPRINSAFDRFFNPTGKSQLECFPEFCSDLVQPACFSGPGIQSAKCLKCNYLQKRVACLI